MGFCSIHQFIDGLQTISCIIIQNNGRLFSLHSSTIFFVLGISIFFPTIKHLGCNICIFLNLFALFFLVHSFFFFFFFCCRSTLLLMILRLFKVLCNVWVVCFYISFWSNVSVVLFLLAFYLGFFLSFIISFISQKYLEWRITLFFALSIGKSSNWLRMFARIIFSI